MYPPSIVISKLYYFTKLQSTWWHHHLTPPPKPQVPQLRKPANGPWHVRCSNGWVNYIGCIILYQVASLVTHSHKAMNQRTLQDERRTLQMIPSLPSIHQFWRVFTAPPPSSLQHSRHLPKLLEVFLPRWMTWRTRKRVNLHAEYIDFAYNQHGIWKNMLLFEKDVMIFQVPNLQVFVLSAHFRCVAVGGYNYIQYIQLEPADMIHLRLSQLIMQAPGYFRKDHPTQRKQNMCSNVCLPVLTPLDSHGTPEMINW